ncbi:hypothetical protein CHS0354_029396 [Potamilus streckersoni]|uniref:MATH domain-containing protein n=1 Tax=Potamilus streckersoni TaxID=2493646 RepID=A0AAE0SU55_9BIVA|nr:hypothetical protein CHS0354_029396 [Potamilus streckersoni]
MRNSQDEHEADHRILTSLMEQIVQLVTTEDNLRQKDEQIAALQKQLQEKSDSDVVVHFRIGVLEDLVFEHLTRFCPRGLPMQLIADQIQDGVHGKGGNIMEICKFEEKKRQAMTNRHLALISDPFITSKGVKMKLKVFLNGDEVEGETCMTVYVIMVRGLNDENLNWRFRGKFTLYVFDPEASNYKFADSFDADPNHFSFQKPCTEKISDMDF